MGSSDGAAMGSKGGADRQGVAGWRQGGLRRWRDGEGSRGGRATWYEWGVEGVGGLQAEDIGNVDGL